MSRITFGGLSSGLDTNALINGLLELERQPIVQKEERIKVLQQKKDAWRDINMRLRHLRSTVQELYKKENMLSKQAVSTNTAYVQATAESTAVNGTYELKISKLATNHTVTMKSDIQTLLGKSTTEAMGLTGNFVLNGVKIEVKSEDTLEDLRDKINNSAAEAEASIIAGHLILKSKTSGLEGALAMSYASGDDVLNTLGICDSEGSFYNKTLPVNHTVSMQSDIEALLGMDETEPLGLAGIFEINGAQIEIESEDTLEDLRDKINSSAAEVEATIVGGHLILKSKISGLGGLMAMSYVSGDDILNTLEIYDSVSGFYDETLPANYTVSMQSDIQSLLGKDVAESLGLAGIFEINGAQIEVTEEDTLEDLRDKINSSVADVEATIVGGQLILESKTSGPEGAIAMSYLSGDDVLNTLEIYNSRGGSFYKETLKAQDAEFSINGISVTRSSNEVKDLIDGVTFRLYGGGAESVYVKISSDTEKAAAAVAAFVEQYNSVNSFIREKLEKPGKNQSEGSTVGLLQGDTTLMKIERNLRSLINSPVSNYRSKTEDGAEQKKYYSFSSIGVTTIDKEGYLQFDAEKFISALEDDPEAVYELLNFEITDEYGVGTGQFDGLGVTLDNYLKGLLVAEQDSLGRTIYPISVREEEAVQRRIDELYRQIEVREERLLRYEERLITQFTALEKYIASMQSQGQDLDNLIKQLPGFGSSKK